MFLLDPWWNPAVEAQAIDRAHRIGQSRHVFAYRLLARDTVEEKVAELQQTKRELADAILNADGGLVRSLKAEDLEMSAFLSPFVLPPGSRLPDRARPNGWRGNDRLL